MLEAGRASETDAETVPGLSDDIGVHPVVRALVGLALGVALGVLAGLLSPRRAED